MGGCNKIFFDLKKQKDALAMPLHGVEEAAELVGGELVRTGGESCVSFPPPPFSFF